MKKSRHNLIVPPLDPAFQPAASWHKWFNSQIAEKGTGTPIKICLKRPDGSDFRHDLMLLPDQEEFQSLNLKALERTVKFLLWQKGGSQVLIDGSDRLAKELGTIYSPAGKRRFDAEIMGGKIFNDDFSIAGSSLEADDQQAVHPTPLGGNLNGCRIGFDLGGSDRKCAAVVDGEVIFSEEIPWDPYFQTDVNYHYTGIIDSLKRAAAHLPKVDAIGGSAAGVYINNQVKTASLFRGIPEERYKEDVENIFLRIAQEWDVPFEVVNDGEVTALAGAMACKDGSLLGIAMGTSEAAGYCDPSGNITPWLNELAFAPIDYREGAPADEWSGDQGCGVQYLSQQAVGRLMPAAAIPVPAGTPLPEQLILAQKRMNKGDDRARKIFESIGVYLGYAIAHYASFYDLRHILLLGRVTSGPAGDILISQAERVLRKEFSPLDENITIAMPDEQNRRHGQAVAAASLPVV